MNERTSYPDLWRSCVNVERMDLVVIQYRTVRFRSPNDDSWRMPLSDSNACLGVRSLGIVGWEYSTIFTAGEVENMNQGKDVMALESHPLLPQHIRAITYRC